VEEWQNTFIFPISTMGNDSVPVLGIECMSPDYGLSM